MITEVKTTATMEDGTKVKNLSAYNFGEDLAGAVEMFGEDVVHSIFKQQAIVKLQHLIRTSLKAGKTEEEIAEAVSEWRPGMVVKADPIATLLKKVKSPEQLEDIVKKLQARIKEGE